MRRGGHDTVLPVRPITTAIIHSLNMMCHSGPSESNPLLAPSSYVPSANSHPQSHRSALLSICPNKPAASRSRDSAYCHLAPMKMYNNEIFISANNSKMSYKLKSVLCTIRSRTLMSEPTHDEHIVPWRMVQLYQQMENVHSILKSVSRII